MFVENGFHGSFTDYQHASNSYLNKVIEDREGLPITLSVLFMHLQKNVGSIASNPCLFQDISWFASSSQVEMNRSLTFLKVADDYLFKEADQMAWERQGVTVDSQQMQIPSEEGYHSSNDQESTDLCRK